MVYTHVSYTHAIVNSIVPKSSRISRFLLRMFIKWVRPTHIFSTTARHLSPPSQRCIAFTLLSNFKAFRGPGWLNELGKWITQQLIQALSPIRRGFAPGFVNYKRGVLDPHPQVIKFTSCLPMVGVSLRVLFFHLSNWSP